MFNFQSRKAAVPAVEVLGTALPPVVDVDESRYVKLGWTVVLVGIVGSLLWASFAPLSKGTAVQGTVVVTGNRKTIQHPTGGIIREILVQDGDEVKAGQVLVRMNDVQTRSQAATVRSQYLTELAMKARLVAEATNAKEIAFPPELMDRVAAHDEEAEDDVRLQQQLLITRRLALKASVGALAENIAGYRAQLAGQSDSQVQQLAERKTLRDQLAGVRQLTSEGYVPRSKLQDLERQEAALNSDISRQTGTTGQLASQMAEARLHIAQMQEDYMKDVRTQLSEVQRDTGALKSRLAESEFQLANTEVRSPVDGTVVGVNVFTDGGTVAAGAKLMEVVPSGEPLEVEGQLQVNLIDKVHKGLPVDMMFTAFNQNSTPKIPGVLTFVSADRLVDDHTGAPYYRVRAKVTPQGMKLLRNLNVRPGMPVEMFVNAGQRSMLSYLLKPLIDRSHTALTED
ncbi:protease secretion system membrane fusion protein [Paraburkholderia sp. BL27I4N3]|uniref:HlyD family type I secretion periplasmic adaptor subunit n=1 Tax=Paraburkholderia sp. BL27I4N3 TaxID=1938805 RepID=UPI000E25C933|nr:HlyD family type I secretion periplasmic adaptor subunit [Paraburkholderia sp. BL27I4N3]REE22615.1 protease secretion system membrane fusion protein [Paraburkholderia sp. BL27I4N3]